MSINVVTPPTAEPVTLDEVRAHLNLAGCDGCGSSGDDVLLLGLVAAARRQCELHTRRACLTQTLRWTLDGFDSCDWTLRLPVAPVQSVTSIVYRDVGGASMTLSPSDYRVALGEPTRLTPAWSKTWPSTRGEIADVEITFMAGWASVAAVPETMKLAICQLVAHWYANRENVNVGNIVNAIPWTVETLLAGLEWSGYP